MRKNLIVLLLALFAFQFLPTSTFATSTSPVTSHDQEKKELIYFKNLKVKDVENFLGRKMSFLEKAAFKIKKKSFVKLINEEEKKRTNGWAITGFVSSLLLPPLGIIFSAIGLSQANKREEKGKGLAIAGLIIGIVFTILLLV